MKKEFIYKNTKFYFVVKLNAEVERRPNGKRLHELSVYDTSLLEAEPFYWAMIENNKIDEGVEEAERICRDRVDGIKDTPEELSFMALGFSKRL